jgi:hypothetical protein
MVRAVLTLLVVGLAAAPATANPRAREVTPSRTLSSVDAREARPTSAPPMMREPGRRSSLANGVPPRRAPVKSARRELTMSSEWNGLREMLYEHMPHGGDERAVSFTLMPMVINGAAESAPGFGLSGSF